MVSVIINCLNGEKYLNETIQSVLSQTYTDWEILLFDNCSTDRTAAVFKQYSDSRFHYYHRQATVSLGEARNEAMGMVRSDYICFLDADDLWEPTFLEVLVHTMEQYNNVGLVYADYAEFADDKTVGQHPKGKVGKRDVNSLLTIYDIGLSAAMFRHEIIIKYQILFNNKYNLIEDLDFFINLAFHTEVFHVGEILAKYRQHANNLSKKLTVWSTEYSDFYNQLLVKIGEDIRTEYYSGLTNMHNKYISYLFSDQLCKKQYRNALNTSLKVKSFKQKLKCLLMLVKSFFIS